MSEAERVRYLEQENERLRRENELLIKTISRMRMTLNRLLDRYITDGGQKKMA